MHQKKKALWAAFPLTIPVMAGYLFLGMAYGILMNDSGFGLGWIFLNSVFVYAGSLQMLGVALLGLDFQPVSIFFITLLVNARHIFYGISMLEKYRGIGKWKPYLIFGLTDETFSIVVSAEVPEDVSKGWFFFFITLLNHGYWVIGSLLGGILGNFIGFDTRGLDFALVALFVVIFVNHWMEQRNHAPAMIGLAMTALSLVVFGEKQFIIPAMSLILIIVLIFRKQIGRRETL